MDKMNKDLEKVAEALADKHGFIKKSVAKEKYTHQMVRDIFIEAVIAGVEWQKEQMMKDAIVGEVVQESKGRFHIKTSRPRKLIAKED